MLHGFLECMKVIVTTRCLACMLANCGSGGAFSFGWKSSKRASQTRAESSQSAPLVSEQERTSNLPITLEGSSTTPLLEEVRTLNQLNTSGFLAVPAKSSLDTQPDNVDHRPSIESQHVSKSVSSAPNESLGAAKPSDGGAFKSSTQATWNVSFQPQKPLMEDMKLSIDSWQGEVMILRWLSQIGISYQLQSMDPWMELLWKDDSKAMKGTGQWMTVSIPLDTRKKGCVFRLRTMAKSSAQTTIKAERTRDLLDSSALAW